MELNNETWKKDEFRTVTNIQIGAPLSSFYEKFLLNPLSANSTKIVKHTHTISREKLTNFLSVFEHF